MADFLEEKRREIQARLKELRPLVDEFQRLEAAERALSGVKPATANGTAATATARKPRAARSTSAAKATSGSGTRRRGRPKGSGTRGGQALEIIRAKPGISIPEIAEAMGIKQNYLYRVMPDLAEQGLVTKSGRGWHVRKSA